MSKDIKFLIVAGVLSFLLGFGALITVYELMETPSPTATSNLP